MHHNRTEPKPSEVKDEYKAWHAYHNATESNKRAKCVECGQPLGGGYLIWFLLEHGPPKRVRRVVHADCATGIGPTVKTKRIEAEPVTAPTKIWEIQDGLSTSTPTATVGYGRPNIEGGPGIRVELLSILTTSESHKDRHIVSKNLHPDLAEALGRALIEAAEQAREGQAPTTKRSAE